MKLRRELNDLPFSGLLTACDGELEDEGHYDGVLFSGMTLEGSEADLARFVECAFSDVTLDGVALRKARLSDVWLRDVRMLSADLAGSSWLDSTFLACSGAGIQAYDGSFQRVIFADCKLDSWNFRGTTLTDVTFENCLLRDADFGGATLKRVKFPGCTLTRADFSRVTLNRTDLRGAELDFTAGYESLRGAIMTTAQLISIAPALARQIGIDVKDL
ncbi:MAG TPA: pentapeptide repeat-containing protein [Streptosporangiaceae bacterium]